jgi:hypothetical protein
LVDGHLQHRKVPTLTTMLIYVFMLKLSSMHSKKLAVVGPLNMEIL